MAEICWDTPQGVVKVHLFLLYIILLLLFVEPPILFHLKNKKSRNPTRVKLKTYSGHLDHRPQAWPWSFQKVAMEIMSCQGCHGKKTSCWNNAEKKTWIRKCASIHVCIYIYWHTYIYICTITKKYIYILIRNIYIQIIFTNVDVYIMCIIHIYTFIQPYTYVIYVYVHVITCICNHVCIYALPKTDGSKQPKWRSFSFSQGWTSQLPW